jgi:hypothetical protein
MREGRDYRTLRFDTTYVGTHRDTGTSEMEVVRAVLDGRADAGAIDSPCALHATQVVGSSADWLR